MKGERGETSGWQPEVVLGSLNREPSVPDGMFNRQNIGAETKPGKGTCRGWLGTLALLTSFPPHLADSGYCNSR